tara:strand:- start:1421 stop:2227 length:807 start_codon:yes stop_codon:yes gene_type:complete
MRGHEWGKGTVKCSMCFGLGHNITTCPVVQGVWKQYFENLGKAQALNKDYYPSWHEKKALREMARREIKKTKPTKKRKKSRCSFCNSLRHKRNKCKKLTKLKALVSKANENWRRCFISEANRNGYGIGSLVNAPTGLLGSPYDLEEFEIGIVSGFDKSKLNVFCAYHGGGQYSSVPAIDVLVGNELIRIVASRFKGYWSEELLPNNSSWQYYEVSSISPHISEMPEEWYKSNDDEAMKWFFDNISMKNRDYEALEELVQKWTKIVLPK